MNIQISGNLRGPTVIFLAGWPDTCDIFRENIMSVLAPDYRLVGITLPGFDRSSPLLRALKRQETARQSAEAAEKKKRQKRSESKFTALRNNDTTKTATGVRQEMQDRDHRYRADTSPSKWRRSREEVTGMTTLDYKLSQPIDSGVHCGPAAASTRSFTSLYDEGDGTGIGNKVAPHLKEQLFRTTWRGYSLQDLVTLLEIAVDTAMEAYNYCPVNFLASSLMPGEEVMDGVPVHQLPPYYHRPVLIAHDWGCLLAYELLLAKPLFFSRIVALDVGASMFEGDAAHVQAMCALLNGGDGNHRSRHPPRRGPSAGESSTALPLSSAAPRTRSSVSSPTGSGEKSGGRRLSELPDLDASITQRDFVSSPVTVAHSLAGKPYDLKSGGPTSPKTRRSLALQYAIRKKQQAPRRGVGFWRGLLILLYQFFIIICHLFVPARLARWFLSLFVRISGRPVYYYDPQLAVPVERELTGRDILAGHEVTHGLFDDQHYACTRAFSGGATDRSSGDDDDGELNSSQKRLPPGWKVVLVPCTRDETLCSYEPADTSREHRAEGYLDDSGQIYQRRSSHAVRVRRCCFYGDSSSNSGGDDQTNMHRLRRRGTSSSGGCIARETNAGAGVHQIYKSYAKADGGTRYLSESMVNGHVDPYRSLNGIGADAASWDSLLTFAIPNHLPPQRGCEQHEGEGGNGTAGSWSGTRSSSDYSQHLLKRTIHYRAYTFPPLSPTTASGSGNGEGSGSGGGTSSILYRRRTCGPQPPSVPLIPVAVQSEDGWIYLRYWVSLIVLKIMMLLFGEEERGGAAPPHTRPLSNVMATTTTIYRHLPTSSPDAAASSSLPGDTGIPIRAKSASPLVSQRFFIPISVPILFMYGGEKRIMFHADHWSSYIKTNKRARDGISDVVEVQGGGHWFFAEKKYQKKVSDRIAEFLEAEPVP